MVVLCCNYHLNTASIGSCALSSNNSLLPLPLPSRPEMVSTKKKRQNGNRKKRRQSNIDDDWLRKKNKQSNPNHNRKHEVVVDAQEVENHRQRRYPRRSAPKPTRLIDEVTKTEVQIVKERKKTRMELLRRRVVQFATLFLQKCVRKGKEKSSKSLTKKQTGPKNARKRSRRETLAIRYIQTANKSYCSTNQHRWSQQQQL